MNKQHLIFRFTVYEPVGLHVVKIYSSDLILPFLCLVCQYLTQDSDW